MHMGQGADMIRCVTTRRISEQDAVVLVDRHENHFWDHKSRKGDGASIRKTASALANADGGEIMVGVEDVHAGSGLGRWQGFQASEEGNYIEQLLVKDVDPAVPYTIEWLEIVGRESQGLTAVVAISKSPAVHRINGDEVWMRRGAQNLRIRGTQVTNLALSKGTESFEDQYLSKYSQSELIREPELKDFLDSYSPATKAQDYVRSQRLVNLKSGDATVAAAVLYATTPPALVPRKCSIKIARYLSKESEALREHLEGTPTTIEGSARAAIDQAIEIVTKMVQAVRIMDADGNLAPSRYPPEALKEIIVNAVIHRDYNVSDDILITVFDNRVEVKSPGRLPGHITTKNILKERFARNPTIVRLLNKYPNPPNKDIGEGLNTAVSKMIEAKLRRPTFKQLEDSFLVVLRHTPLARPETLVLEYLDNHPEVTNSAAREFCGIRSENAMKDVFIRLARASKIEPVPGKKGNKSAWRLIPGATGLPDE